MARYMIANTIHSAVGPGVVAVDAFAAQTGRRRAFDELHMHGVKDGPERLTHKQVVGICHDLALESESDKVGMRATKGGMKGEF